MVVLVLVLVLILMVMIMIMIVTTMTITIEEWLVRVDSDAMRWAQRWNCVNFIRTTVLTRGLSVVRAVLANSAVQAGVGALVALVLASVY